MKRISLIILLFLSFCFSALLLSSCDIFSLGGTDTPETGDDPPSGTAEYVTVSLYEKSTNSLISKLEVEKGTVPSEEIVNAIKGTNYHGYTFAEWYYTIFGSKAFDPTLAIEDDIILYGDRGNLAGPNATWHYDDLTKTLTISGSGTMFNYLFAEDVPWIQYAKLVENINIDDGITAIGDCAFYNFGAISSVTLPDCVDTIGQCAFYESTICEINFSQSLKTIEERAFYKCTNLTALNFNQGLQYIGRAAFSECTGVVNVVLTDEIMQFGNSAFYMCTNLKTAYYVGTEEKYNDIVFRLDNFWVKQLANTYFISETAPAAPGPYWYYGEDGSTRQWYYTVGFRAPGTIIPFVFDYVDAKLGVTQANIDFMNSLVYHGYKFASFSGAASGIENYEVGLMLNRDIRLEGNRGNICGDSMTWRFSRQTLYINGTGDMWDFETTKDSPWFGRNVVNVVIGNEVEHIGANAFSSLTSLVSIDIPTNVTSIHKNAFVGCNDLKYVYYLGTKEQLSNVLGIDKLENMLDAVVYSYNESGSGDGNHWREVVGGNEPNRPRRVAWTLLNGTLTVGGDTSLVLYSDVKETPWYPDRERVHTVIIRDGSNRVGHNSFYGMTSVTSITIPNTVMKISESAFYGTGYWENADNWENGALYISKHLIKVDGNTVSGMFRIADGTVSIAENAFEGCVGITELVYAKETIGVYASVFAALESLERIYFTGSLSSTWDGIWSSGNNLASQELDDVDIYYYSVTEPSDNGLWWHYSTTDMQTAEVVAW